MNVEKYYNEKGEVALLISHGWGAGWSTWNQKECAYDRRFVEAFLNDEDEYILEEKAEKEWGYDRLYFGGWSDIDEITWVKPGTIFKIEEYDGNEYLITADDMEIA